MIPNKIKTLKRLWLYFGLVVLLGSWLSFIWYSDFLPQPNKSSVHHDLPTTTKGQQRQVTRAVIHMGPHKTGTASIQFAAHLHSEQLQQDGFDTVCSMEKKNTYTREFSSCFLPPNSGEAKSYPCWYEYLLAGSSIASKKRNLFVSAEDFAVIGLQESDGVEKLHDYISQWDNITIVLYYRHYFSFLGSKYNQRTKNKSIQRGHYKTIQDFMLLVEKGEKMKYTVELMKRLEKSFDNIVIVNMHDRSKGDPAESFFCHALSFFEKTCEAIRSTPKEKRVHRNPSVKLHNIHLLAGAVKAGLLSKEKAIESSVQSSVQRKVEAIEESLGTEMKMKCLAPEILQDLWQQSLMYKRLLFPTTSSTTSSSNFNLTAAKEDELTEDEIEMKSEFELAANSSLCMVDVDDALSQAEWKEFFKSI